MGTAEGVIVKARELIGAALGRSEIIDEEAAEDEGDVDTARLPVPVAEAPNGHVQTEG
ncbi:hypothetical protein [Mycobacterium sp.]|uniref:hypothetical protein n=1 Tax=Mycobacterium sp. TaxID=1785 RepID=UPI002C14F9D0|nr:hypothetical protein [Mycobacterium sp.]HME50363.1 hypothetical protein [Mycobacterium sp.]